MSAPTLLTATFRATTYSKARKGFAFPKGLFEAFGFGENAEVALIVQTPTGDILFRGVSRFISGSEITEAAACRNLDFSQEIVVTAMRTK